MLAGIGAIHGLGVYLELLPPSSHRPRLVFRLRMWFTVWLGVPSSQQFGGGFPGCIPRGVGVGGPVLVLGVVGFEALAFGGQLEGEGCGAGRAGVVVLGIGVDELLESIGFGLRGESRLTADVRRGGGAGTFALKDSCLKVAAVQAAPRKQRSLGSERGLATPSPDGKGEITLGPSMKIMPLDPYSTLGRSCEPAYQVDLPSRGLGGDVTC